MYCVLCTAPALEDNDVSVAGPGDVRVMRSLLDMLRGKGIETLELEPGVHLLKTLDTGIELLFVEHGEHRQDALLHQEVQGWLPELEHPLGVETRVDAHGNIGHLDLLGSDPPKKRSC